MERKSPVVGDIYRHFKGKLYQIVGIAAHSETKEKQVVYQALYGDFSMYVRPYDMFVSEVDHVKYPEVKQKYRFEQIGTVGNMTVANINSDIKYEETAKGELESALADSNNIHESEQSEEAPNPDLIAFLDADTFKDKRQLLIAMRPRMTDRLINDIAASLDVTVEEGDIEKRFKSLLYCVSKLDEYEVSRLR